MCLRLWSPNFAPWRWLLKCWKVILRVHCLHAAWPLDPYFFLIYLYPVLDIFENLFLNLFFSFYLFTAQLLGGHSDPIVNAHKNRYCSFEPAIRLRENANWPKINNPFFDEISWAFSLLSSWRLQEEWFTFSNTPELDLACYCVHCEDSPKFIGWKV